MNSAGLDCMQWTRRHHRIAELASRTDDFEHDQTHRVQKIFSSGNFFVDIKLALGNNPALFCWVMLS
jgi:hypothetical protein